MVLLAGRLKLRPPESLLNGRRAVQDCKAMNGSTGGDTDSRVFPPRQSHLQKAFRGATQLHLLLRHCGGSTERPRCRLAEPEPPSGPWAPAVGPRGTSGSCA